MTAAELIAWQRRCGLRTERDAARVLGIATSTYRSQSSGRSGVTRQTEIICAYHEVFGRPLMLINMSAAAQKLAHLTDTPIDVMAEPAIKTLAKVLDPNVF